MRKQVKGFSPIELLIVVAIIVIIAAIAIPNLMRARMAADDSSAAASEHTSQTDTNCQSPRRILTPDPPAKRPRARNQSLALC